MTPDDAAARPPDLPGLDPAWSRLVPVPDGHGGTRVWHVLDAGPPASTEPVGTLLCVHGNPTWSYLWRGLVASPPSGWRVLAPDHPGMGYSQRTANALTLRDRIDDLGRLTDALGVTGPVVLVAHDWGGPVSLGWAMEHRDQLRGVVLTNTAVHQPSTSAPPSLIRLAHAPALRHAVCVATPTFVRGATALSRPRPAREVREAFAAPYGTPGRRAAVGDFVADIPFERDHPSRGVLDSVADGVRGLDVPALLLWGARDPVFGEQYLRDLRERLPRARVHRYERASHLLPEDAPQYADAVRQWVADLDAGDALVTDGAAAGDQDGAGPMLWDALDDRAADDSPAVVEVGGVRVSWCLLARRTREVAAGLAAAGVRRGDRVALLVPPSADLTAAVYAVWRAGAVVVVADRGLGLRGMGRALRGAQVSHVVGTGQGLAAARAMRLPGTRIAAGPLPAATRRLLGVDATLADLARLGRSSAVDPPVVHPDDECAVLFTSGATGPAKGVVYRHRQASAQIRLLRATYGLGPADRIVAAFAPFALLGPALGVASAVPAVDVTAPGTLTATALADAAAAVGATVVFASPAALRNVTATAGELADRQREALARVRLLMSAGAPVAAPLLRRLCDVLPSASAHTPYGMTEALPVTDVTLDEIEAAGPGEGVCVGRPLPGVQVAVSPLDPAGAADGPLTTDPGVTGEICVSAAHVKDRYDSLWATQRASARNPGWHRTGDVGHLDAQGRLWMEGRLAHVLRTAHRVVTPVGPEQRVETLRAVRSAAVVGVGPTGVEQVVVVVVPDDGRVRGPVAGLELTDEVRRVAGVPVAAVLQRQSLPVDIRHQSKIDRTRLGEWASGVLAGR